MPTAYSLFNTSSLTVGSYIEFSLMDLLGFNIHSAHPQYFKRPAHMLIRNPTCIDFGVFADNGVIHILPQTSTTVIELQPSITSITLKVEAVNSTGTGQSTFLQLIYYYPGEPIPLASQGGT